MKNLQPPQPFKDKTWHPILCKRKLNMKHHLGPKMYIDWQQSKWLEKEETKNQNIQNIINIIIIPVIVIAQNVLPWILFVLVSWLGPTVRINSD